METQNKETVYIQTESNSAATTSLVLGIIGFIVGLIPYIGWFMAPVWLLAIIFGLVGMRKKYKRGTAIIGFIFGLIGAAYKIGFWILAAGGILFTSLTLSGGGDGDNVNVENSNLKAEGAAPEFALEDMDGNTHRLSDYKGKGVVLYFWTTYSPPSRTEIVEINNLYKEYKDEGVEILAIDMGESESSINEFISQYDLILPVLADTSSEIRNAYNIESIPTTVLIDPNGEVSEIHIGELTEKDRINYMDRIKP